MSSATWIRDDLARKGIAFKECHHPAAYTAQGVAQQEHISGHHVAKVVVVMADNQPIELILPASRRVLLDWVRDLSGARAVRLATEGEMARQFTDCEPGTVPALRHWQNVDVWMDSALKTAGDILFQAGTHCDAIRMRFDDWFTLVRPRVEIFSLPANEPALPEDDFAE